MAKEIKNKVNNGKTLIIVSLILGLSILGAAYFLSQRNVNNKSSNINDTKNSNPLCLRTQPYIMAPEFVRAVSLLKQRGAEAKNSAMAIYLSYNCLDIQYSDLSKIGAEGYFLFDPNSSTQDIKVYVSNDYKSYDDILTAVLLAHELRHVNQFLEIHLAEYKNRIISCVHKEVQAFSVELDFINNLNQEERSSLYLRLVNNPNKNSAYQGILQLLAIRNGAADLCGNDFKCYNDNVLQKIRTMVLDNPFYQKQCEGHLNDPAVSYQ